MDEMYETFNQAARMMGVEWTGRALAYECDGIDGWYLVTDQSTGRKYMLPSRVWVASLVCDLLADQFTDRSENEKICSAVTSFLNAWFGSQDTSEWEAALNITIGDARTHIAPTEDKEGN